MRRNRERGVGARYCRGMTAVETLSTALRELILDARMAPGEPLREEALAGEYGVNRHTVRAALQRLAAQRLVTFEPYRGARVRAFTTGEVQALMEYRAALECEALRLWPGDGSAGVPAAVSAANADLVAVCRRHPDDHRGIERAHAALHHAIVRASGSARIIEAHAGLESELLLFLNQLRPLLPAAEMIEQHEGLVAALATPRGDAALRAHLAHSAEQLIGRLEG